MTPPHELRIAQAQVIRYKMPLKRPYGTARGVTTAGVNFLVRLRAEHDGHAIEAIGECQPRHALTGDGGKDRIAAWAFARAAVGFLENRTLAFTARDDALTVVRGTIAQLHECALSYADDSNRDRPFRGTLLGLEVALLDAVSQKLGLQLSELLGKQRDIIHVSISTLSSTVDLDKLAERAIKQTRYPMTRVKGIGDISHDLRLLDIVTQANRSQEREKPLWIDINEALDFEGASSFVLEVAQRMNSGAFPSSLVIEGMLPKDQVLRLPELQQLADATCSTTPSGNQPDLRIMPDEGLWDATDLAKLNAAGGCRAINIKAPKAGGLIASLELANAAVASNPDIRISIGGMLGTSDVTAWALHNLARALPRIDYLTAVPPRNVESRIGDPVAKYEAEDSSIIAAQTRSGLGTRLRLDRLTPYIEASYSPSEAIRAQDEAAKDSGHTTRTLVFGGDTSMGEVYAKRQGGALMHRLANDPMSFFEGLAPLTQHSDALILNLETVLADSPTSPFEAKKRFLGWELPSRTIDCLTRLGVTAVGLANNHTMDYGAERMLEMKAALEEAGIKTFGAGANQREAATPLTIPLEFGSAERRVHIINAMQIQRSLRDDYGFYAGSKRPGVNGLAITRLVEQIQRLRSEDPQSFIIVFPHWGRNYKWADEAIQRAAAALSEAGANLILGHGAHMLQQTTFSPTCATVYSLGNFLFNWGGRFEKYGAPPFGLVSRVGLGYKSDCWQVDLRLYPIVADNRATAHRPQAVSDIEFEAVISALRKADIDGSFTRNATFGEDTYGRFLRFVYRTDGHPTAASILSSSETPQGTRHPVASKFFEGADALGREGIDSYLLARAALRRRLCCARLSTTVLLIGRTPARVGEAGFHHTASTLTPRIARDVTRELGYLRAVLSDAGVPTTPSSTSTTYRAVVIDDAVVSWLRDRPGADAADADVPKVHPAISQLAVRATRLIPGLRHAEVKLSMDDPTANPGSGEVAVVGIESSIPLALHEAASARRGASLADELVRAHFGHSDARDSSEPGHFLVTLTHVSAAVATTDRIRQVATDLDISVTDISPDGADCLSMQVAGDPAGLAALMSLVAASPDAPEVIEVAPGDPSASAGGLH